jgi:cyclohexanone monooxygenase
MVVIGAGFSGLYMAYKAREMGLDVHGYERGDDVGGTWYWNRYPGASSDSQSWVYQYSFDKQLEQDWDWSSVFPEQPEILSYLGHVADRFELRGLFEFDTSVEGIHYRDEDGMWEVTTAGGDTVEARYVVTAVGCLSAAQAPDIPGLDSFTGRTVHTSNWPHEGLDLTGLRVGVIGTGSTGIQMIPRIAEQVAHVTVFQRTPQWAVPARNRTLTDEERADVKGRIGDIREVCRTTFLGHPYAPLEQSALAVDDDERIRKYQEDWDEGGFSFVFGSYGDLITDERANATVADFVREKIRELVDDPDVAARLTPDYPIATKRLPLFAENFFPVFNRDNVELVSLWQDPIVSVVPEGVRTESGVTELDLLIFATGFDAITGPLLRLNITGRDGLELADKWRDGPNSYLGLLTRGFPNLFMITGPGSPSVLGNMPVTIEQNVDWIGDCIEHLRGVGAAIEPTEDAERGWGRHINELADATLLGKYASWYSGSNIPGKPKSFVPYAGGFDLYLETATSVAENGYEGFEIDANRR